MNTLNRFTSDRNQMPPPAQTGRNINSERVKKGQNGTKSNNVPDHNISNLINFCISNIRKSFT